MARANGIEESDISKQIETVKQDIAGLNKMIGQLVEDKSEETTARARRGAAEAKGAVADIAEEAQMRATAAAEQMQRQAEAAYGTAEQAVRRQPALAVGLAAGAGFLVGLMATRRG